MKGEKGKFRIVLVEIADRLGGGVMAYIADEVVLGRSESDEERGIILRVPPSLSRGEPVDEETIRAVIRDPRVSVVLLYGARSVGIGIEEGYVDPGAVLRVGGLEHAIVYKFLVS